tara:strand:- start:14 stop:1069 length:1056 start_codon:yes stop_codon:yes gene_type:complete
MSQHKSVEAIKDYYGKVLSTNEDLQTSACCTAEAMPSELRKILPEIHQEVRDKFYGCGSPFPPALEGRTVLDLGCGAGRDVYMLSKLVGPTGKVIGVDMTDEQLAVAEKHIQYHTDKFGYDKANVRFVKGYIEDLTGAGIEENSVDLVVSNCVTNLSPDKPRLFSEVFKVLKPGGELYFSDVFADRRIPAPLTEDPVLLGECLGGAMYIEDFRRTMHELGCKDFRSITSNKISLNNAEIERKIGMVNFYSITFRAFKVDLEDRCEDFGQVAYYKGTIPGHPHSFTLDDHHEFFTGKPMLVCGNSADMVSKTAYAEHFRIEGDKSTHLGLFDCGPGIVTSGTNDEATGGACC